MDCNIKRSHFCFFCWLIHHLFHHYRHFLCLGLFQCHCLPVRSGDFKSNQITSVLRPLQSLRLSLSIVSAADSRRRGNMLDVITDWGCQPWCMSVTGHLWPQINSILTLSQGEAGVPLKPWPPVPSRHHRGSSFAAPLPSSVCEMPHCAPCALLCAVLNNMPSVCPPTPPVLMLSFRDCPGVHFSLTNNCR